MAAVLLVDDHPVNRYLLEATLKGEGYRVFSASQGAEALILARSERPDAIVSDVLMPVMDGFSLCHAWQLDDDLRSIPFIFYTATYTERSDIEFGLSLGAVAYLLKPDQADELRDAVRAAVSANRSVPHCAAKSLSEAAYLETYNRSLVQKLEDKLVQLEQAKLRLEAEIAVRQRAEAELQERSRLLDLTSDAIVRLDLAGRVTLWNAGAAAIFGHAPAEAIGRTWKELFGDDCPVLAHGLESELERTLSAKSGEPRTIFKRWKSIIGPAGQPDGVMVVGTDVTETRRLQQQSQRAQRLEFIGAMTSGLAHDLNNILAPVVALAPALSSHVASPRGREMLSTIDGCVERAVALLRQLLGFGRGGSLQPVPVSVEALFAELAAPLREVLPANVALDVKIEGELPRLLGQPLQLHQILLNLGLNARDAMPDGGTLSISARLATAHDRPFVSFRIADTGLGIAPEHLPRIFDEFFSTKPIGQGTGLGLATVRTLVREHGGTVEVTSTPGLGTSFKLLLPAFDESPAARAVERTAPRILLFEPQRSIGTIIEQILTSAGYAPTLVPRGSEADSLADASSASAAIVEWPDGDADHPQVAALLARGVPILALVDFEPDEPLPVAATLKKPFTADQLLSCIAPLRGRSGV